MRVALLGAAGTIGPAIARDLAASEEVDGLTLLDLDGERARSVAEAHGNGKATAAAVDASDPQQLVFPLEGCGLLVNAASYRINLRAMDAALAAGCSYLDLGGLYHVTERQLALSDAFTERGLLALLGVGAGPGKTNVMAARAARELDRVERVRCASAGLDADPPAGLAPPYALQTLLDELSMRPVVQREGSSVEIEPLTDGGTIRFPDPIGERGSIYTLHSEVLTLPTSLNALACDFRLSLEPAVLSALTELVGQRPEEIAQLRLERPSPQTYSAQHVTVSGSRDGSLTEVVVTALTVPHAEWGLGGGVVSTAAVAAAAVRLYARGQLPYAGALPPERCLDPDALFAELETRGCRIEISVRETAGSEVT